MIVQPAPRAPCLLPEMPPRPRSLGGELLEDGRIALAAAPLRELNLWLSAAYERMTAAERCLESP